jgi:hypothetical protein
VWIALWGDRVVGQIAAQRCGLRAGGRDYPAGWIVDVIMMILTALASGLKVKSDGQTGF